MAIYLWPSANSQESVSGHWKGQVLRVCAWEQTSPMFNACIQIDDLA